MFPDHKIAQFEGFRLAALDNNDWVSQRLLNGHDFCAEQCSITTVMLGGVVQPFVLDIGANLGAYSIKLAALLAKRGGHVLAFEPQRLIYYHLCQSIVLNKLSNVHAMNLALGDQTEWMDMPTSFDGKNCNYGAVSLDSGINQQRGWNVSTGVDALSRVEVRPLDSLSLNRRIDFLKIDVEGLEAKVLRGAVSSLEDSNWPPMILEVWKDEKLLRFSDDALQELKVFGYRILEVPNQDDVIAVHPNHPIQAIIEEPSPGRFILRRRD